MSKLMIILLTVLLIGLPVSAHLPEVEDPENYIPVLGWVTTIEGDVLVKTLEGDELEVSEEDPITGNCIIETGDEGHISVSLEDYQKHRSTLTVDYNSRVEINLSSGKHFDDTISHKWYIDPHQVTLDMEQGHLYVTIITDNEEYDFDIDTPNAEVRLPGHLQQHNNIDFFLSVEKDEDPGDMDMGNQMQDFFSQLHQMAGEESDEETAESYAKLVEEANEGINAGQQSGFNITGHGIRSQLEVFAGEVKFSSDTDAGSADEITVRAGEVYLVDGINPPVSLDKVEGKSSIENPAQEKPAVSLNIELDERSARPELAASTKTQLDIVSGESNESADSEVPAEMMKTDVWVYEVNGDPDKVLKDNSWPAGTEKKIERKDMGEEIFNLVDNFGDSLDKVWGEDWSFKAEMEAEKFFGREFISVTYSYTVPPFNTYTVNVVSPWLDPRTLKLYEGTFLMIIETSMEMPF